MTIYARVEDGIVREVLDTPHDARNLFHAGLQWVDVTGQAPRPAHGWVYDGKGFSPPPAPPVRPLPPELAFANARAVGCDVSCKADPELTGTFPIDDAAMRVLMTLHSRISAGLGFPNGVKTIAVYDTRGSARSLSPEQVTKLADALSAYVYDLSVFTSGRAPAAPKQPVEIS